jgi:hypothetical protein
MTLQYSSNVRNAQLDAFETTAGGTAILKIYQLTAAAPASCAAAITGTVLATMTLPADWMNAASGGSKTLAGAWSDASADSAGTADWFRIFANDGTTCHAQGTVNQGSGDISLDNKVIAAGQTVTISTFTITAGNA